MLKNWVIFISARNIRTGRMKRKVSPGMLSAIGIAVGVMALITVISVMNGFQMGFIEDILEISSYHLRITDVEPDRLDEINNLKGIRSVMPFYETQTLVTSEYNIEPCLVKGIPDNAEELDPVFFSQLNILRGKYAPETAQSVVIGRILALRLGLGIGDKLSVVALNGGAFRKLQPDMNDFVISGIFQSGYDDFDVGLIIMSSNDLKHIDEGAQIKYGVKIDNRFRDRQAVAAVKALGGIEDDDVVSWREYNRAFFSALKLEKSMMFVILGLIFLVVSFGIFNSIRRTIAEKQEDIGILRAIGSTPKQIRQIFLIDGLIIGAGGGLGGVIGGLLITLNVNEILGLLSLHSSFLVNMPVRIVTAEIITIFIAAVCFCLFSAYAASSKVSIITPQEVLRYE